MNIDNVIEAERKLNRAIGALISLGANNETLAGFNLAGTIVAEVRHHMVCVRDTQTGGPNTKSSLNTINQRLLAFIKPSEVNDDRKGSTYNDIVERATKMREGERGGFAQALALAWDRADTDNAMAIEFAFPHLFLR